MHRDLDHLIQLQQLDNAAERSRQAIAAHPQKLEALDQRLQQAEADVAAAKAHLNDCQTLRRGLEKELASVQGRLARFKDQLMEVKTNKEYQAMQKEIAAAESDVREIEDRLLERMLEADDLALAARRADNTLLAERSAVDAERRAAEQMLVALERELEEGAAARGRLTAEIDAAALAVFEQVMRSRRGVAVAEARDGLCTECHVRIRPQVFNELRSNQTILQCESCQRILYFVGQTQDLS